MDMKHGKMTARRFLSAILVLMMCFGMLPVTAFAAGTDGISSDDVAAQTGNGEVPDAETGSGEDSADVKAAGAGTASRHFRMSVMNSVRAASEIPPGSYEVSLEWIGDSRYCTLSNDRTHAEWNFEGPPDMSFVSSSMGQMFDMKLRLKASALDVGEFSLNIPCIQYSKEHTTVEKFDLMGNISAGQFVEFVVDDVAFLQNVIDVGCLSVVKVRDG